MILNDIETSKQARLVLRELIKGNKSRAQLWSALVDNQLDNVDLRFILPPLKQDGYIEESEDIWHILPKGVKYMDTYDRMILEGLEGYLEGEAPSLVKAKRDRQLDIELQREGNRWGKYGFIVALISVILGLVYFLYEKLA